MCWQAAGNNECFRLIAGKVFPFACHVLDTFIFQQQQLLELLHASAKVSLNKTKTGISISKWIRLRLGDTFRVVICHDERHIQQAGNILRRSGISI